MKTICFTGRRPKDLCGYLTANYRDFATWLTNYLESFYAEGVRNFISGGAQGFDQIAFWCVDNLKPYHPDVKNILYLPFKGQGRKWAEFGLFSKEQYQCMIDAADEVRYLHEVNCENYGEIARALLDRNHQMVDVSEAVIALYPSDTYQTNSGGTSECMRYARPRIPIYQIKYNTLHGTLNQTEVVLLDPQ